MGRSLVVLSAVVLALTFCDGQDRPRVLVVYYSMTGHTRTMAEAVAEGARSVEGVTVYSWAVPNGNLEANQNQHLAGSSTLPIGECSPTRQCRIAMLRVFSTALPDNIQLPSVFYGEPIRGVELGSLSIPTDLGRL